MDEIPGSELEAYTLQKRDMSALRFAVPIMIENTATTVIGMIFSMLIGGISGSALAAVGTSNNFVAFLTAMFSMLTTGSALLVSRYAGAGDRENTSRTVEQTLLMTIAASLFFTLMIELFTYPLMSLLITNGDADMTGNAVRYMRIMILSFPCLMLYNVCASICRATRNSRAPMLVAISMNVVQIFFAFLFLRVFELDMLGAGLCVIAARLFGAVLLMRLVLRETHNYTVKKSRIFRPERKRIGHIVRVGATTSIESTCVQFGYLLANILTVGLGTQAASTYQVVTSITTFPALPMGICSAIAITVVGQHIGAREYDKAKRSERTIWLWCVGVSAVLGIAFALLGEKLTRLYTDDDEIARVSAILLWVQLSYIIPGASINSLDPALRVGGELNFVMLESCIGVWGIRLPLSYILGYVCGLGIWGIFYANGISLIVRMIIGIVKRERGRWIHETL